MEVNAAILLCCKFVSRQLPFRAVFLQQCRLESPLHGHLNTSVFCKQGIELCCSSIAASVWLCLEARKPCQNYMPMRGSSLLTMSASRDSVGVTRYETAPSLYVLAAKEATRIPPTRTTGTKKNANLPSHSNLSPSQKSCSTSALSVLLLSSLPSSDSLSSGSALAVVDTGRRPGLYREDAVLEEGGAASLHPIRPQRDGVLRAACDIEKSDADREHAVTAVTGNMNVVCSLIRLHHGLRVLVVTYASLLFQR